MTKRKARHTHHVNFRLPEELWKQLCDLAEKELDTPSAYIRRAILRFLQNEKSGDAQSHPKEIEEE